MCDNTATVHILNKGRSKCLAIMRLMRTFTYCAALNSFAYTAVHVAGSVNSLADALSRLQIQKFRQLAPDADLLPTPCPPPSAVIWSSQTQ